MTSQTTQNSYQLLDGSEIEITVRTDEPPIARIFTTDMGKRIRSVTLADADTDRSLAAFRSAVPDDRTDDYRSTTTHALPAGSVTVSIDASGKATHGYLYHLATAAVAYTHAVDVQVGQASLLTAVLMGGGFALIAAGQGLLGFSSLAVGTPFLVHVAVYCLSARGLTPSLSRTPRPTESSL
jgi:hypothetical protein